VAEQREERRPQRERLEVVGVVEGFDQLLEVVEGDELVGEVDGGAADDFHGGTHQLGFGGAAEEG
jgi:hypothetical protein